MGAYGPDGGISRFHNPDNYTRALGGVLRSRCAPWKPLLADRLSPSSDPQQRQGGVGRQGRARPGLCEPPGPGLCGRPARCGSCRARAPRRCDSLGDPCMHLMCTCLLCGVRHGGACARMRAWLPGGHSAACWISVTTGKALISAAGAHAPWQSDRQAAQVSPRALDTARCSCQPAMGTNKCFTDL